MSVHYQIFMTTNSYCLGQCAFFDWEGSEYVECDLYPSECVWLVPVFTYD